MVDEDHFDHQGKTLEASFPVLLEEEYFSDLKKNDPSKRKRSHSINVELPSSQHQMQNRSSSILPARDKPSLMTNEENFSIADDLFNIEEIVQEFTRARFSDKLNREYLQKKHIPAPKLGHMAETFKKITDNHVEKIKLMGKLTVDAGT